MNHQASILFRPETHRRLYVLLLIATPFLLLQNYLQPVIGKLSNLSFNIFDVQIPLTVAIAVVIICVILYFSYHKINKLRIISWVVVILFFWVGQQSTDYYFNHKYYELQFNWHYIAYAIFAYLNYRVLSKKNTPANKIIFFTFLSALAISALDEFLQMPLSDRIFDIGDISKDLWGSMIGLVFVFFILENGKILSNGWKIRHKKPIDYYKNPLSLFILEIILAYIFMVVASLLTETIYIFYVLGITVILFVLVFSVIHLLQYKVFKIVFLVLFSVLIIFQFYFIYKNYKKNISNISTNLIVYRGVPLYFFDVMIYPNGAFRFVDKKKNFNQRDQQTIMNLCENILIIGSGTDSSGGKGFNTNEETQFVFNKKNNQGIQIIILGNDEACEKFNTLNAQGKRPMLILHNN